MDNSKNLTEIWEKLLKEMDSEIGTEFTDLWIRPIKPLIIENHILTLEVPDSIIYENVKHKYHHKIVTFFKNQFNAEIEIKYSMSLDVPKRNEAPPSIPVSSSIATAKKSHNFNPNYTFQSFIVGMSNRWAYSSAEAVAKSPGMRYNPFFIYSQPGLGKTHLLHAIANEMLKNNPHAKITYIPSESFVNEYINALRRKDKSTDDFRQKYRSIDCLLLDDIQFLAGKDRSEEEFFYTFNHLSDSKKQIVVTSDRSPRELALGQRLISRFLSGVVADIRFPELETRIAILRQKNLTYGFDIPDDILTFIAENVKESIRELEGALLTVGNFFTNMNIQPSIDQVRHLMKKHKFINPEEEENIDVERIKSVVAKKYNINPKDFKSQKRMETIAYPRQIAMYLATVLTDMSLPSIGKSFNKDHSTVVYAKKKLEQKIHQDTYFSALINQLINEIKDRREW